ncbi:hypothetical protein HDV05_007414, partial [Chytridiales sp. JEL 0842]
SNTMAPIREANQQLAQDLRQPAHFGDLFKEPLQESQTSPSSKSDQCTQIEEFQVAQIFPELNSALPLATPNRRGNQDTTIVNEADVRSTKTVVPLQALPPILHAPSSSIRLTLDPPLNSKTPRSQVLPSVSTNLGSVVTDPAPAPSRLPPRGPSFLTSAVVPTLAPAIHTRVRPAPPASSNSTHRQAQFQSYTPGYPIANLQPAPQKQNAGHVTYSRPLPLVTLASPVSNQASANVTLARSIAPKLTLKSTQSSRERHCSKCGHCVYAFKDKHNENNTSLELREMSLHSSLASLPPEHLLTILSLTPSNPSHQHLTLPLVCRRFRSLIQSQPLYILCNIDLVSEDEEEPTVGLLTAPETPKLLKEFKECLITTTPNGKPKIVKVGIERSIKLHVSAIPGNPHTLVDYLGELMKRGVRKDGGEVRVVFGEVQVKGRRGATSEGVLGGFLGALKPLNITLWWWDSNLIASLPLTVNTLLLPNMRADAHIQASDTALLQPFAGSLKRLELFRPMPRQPWGIEAAAFGSLSVLDGLKELVVRTGRLVGSSEVLVASVVGLKGLEVLELPWNIDARFGVKLIREMPQLRRLQFIHVTTPDFFQGLPTFHPIPLSSSSNLLSAPSFTASDTPPLSPLSLSYSNLHLNILSKTLPTPPPYTSLQSLGLTYMEPDAGDFAILVEGLIRSLPCLSELFLRINARQENPTYDFFSSLPRDFMERTLRRLEGKTELK